MKFCGNFRSFLEHKRRASLDLASCFFNSPYFSAISNVPINASGLLERVAAAAAAAPANAC